MKFINLDPQTKFVFKEVTLAYLESKVSEPNYLSNGALDDNYLIVMTGSKFNNIKGGFGTIFKLQTDIPINFILHNSSLINITTTEGALFASYNLT